MSRSVSAHVLLCLFGLVFLAGCDALGAEETVILSDTEVTFRYSFEGGDISTSETNELRSDGTVSVDLSGTLENRGFSLQDLRSVTVREASLQLTFPVSHKFDDPAKQKSPLQLLFPEDHQLDFMETVEVLVATGNLSPTRVAQRMEIPDGRRSITIPAESAKNIQSYVRSSMNGRLRIDADQELPDNEYEMDLTLGFDLEVGGL
jgi:hypothetical protein